MELRKQARAKFGRNYATCEDSERNLLPCSHPEYPLLCAWCFLPLQCHGHRNTERREHVINCILQELKTDAAGLLEAADAGNRMTGKELQYALVGIERDCVAESPGAERWLIRTFINLHGFGFLAALSEWEREGSGPELEQRG